MQKSKKVRLSIGGTIVEATFPSQPGNAGAAAVFLPGFPSTLGDNPLLSQLLEQGYAVYFVQYPGTDDSSGHYTPAEAIAAVSRVAKSLASGQARDLSRNMIIEIPSDLAVIVGYSFGAFVALRAQWPVSVRKCLLVSPAATYGRGPDSCGFKAAGIGYLDDIRRTRPHTYRFGPDAEWDAFYRGELDLPLKGGASGLQDVLTLAGDGDASLDVAVLQTNLPKLLDAWKPGLQRSQIEIAPGGGHTIGELVDQRGLDLIRHFLTRP